ncbi:uncharacterized protein QC761_123743 [Podospora bellae-mahoneyi]|uniref:Uncharacterized protein n=1 Tax=Podospora bellae-mahoneyi TaxID=2093777 RepID=A0ABR0FTF9_9PEZI|nr:hypothetical protein QC761_123743 [Podospora bellae-mahoneyi]
MCRGTKSRMSCGHFHVSFHERCHPWCNEPQVQFIGQKDERCGHCIAKTQVDSSRASRLQDAWDSYCNDAKQKVLVSLREKIISANREIRALKEEFPDLDGLSSELERVRKEQSETMRLIHAQMERAKEEGAMKGLLLMQERKSSLQRKTDSGRCENRATGNQLRESIDGDIERLNEEQVMLMERSPELTRLIWLDRQLAQLGSNETTLCSHDSLAKLDAITRSRDVYVADEIRLTEERLSNLKSIEGRLRHQAMQEKAEVKNARCEGRAAAQKEPDSDLVQVEDTPVACPETLSLTTNTKRSLTTVVAPETLSSITSRPSIPIPRYSLARSSLHRPSSYTSRQSIIEQNQPRILYRIFALATDPAECSSRWSLRASQHYGE